MIAANQPYFAPYPGFFHKLYRAERFVLLDSVQFPRGTTWISRNRFKNDQGTLWITLPVRKRGLGLQVIRDVRIVHDGRWERKHLESLRTAYQHAPYFREHASWLAGLFRCERLIDVNLAIIRHVVEYLALETPVILLSELGIETRGARLPVDLCRRLGARRFLAQAPAAKFLDPVAFREAGIELCFIKVPRLVYPQLWGPFVANLSILDLIFNCGPRSRELVVTGRFGGGPGGDGAADPGAHRD